MVAENAALKTSKHHCEHIHLLKTRDRLARDIFRANHASSCLFEKDNLGLIFLWDILVLLRGDCESPYVPHLSFCLASFVRMVRISALSLIVMCNLKLMESVAEAHDTYTELTEAIDTQISGVARMKE